MKSKIIRLIAIYEMIGGSVGLFLVVMNGKFSTLKGYVLMSLSFTVFMLILYLFSLRGGYLLWKRKKPGALISIIVQICQTPYSITAACLYRGSIGAQILVGIKDVGNIYNLVIYHSWMPYFQIALDNVVRGTIIGVNITPIIIICLIILIQKNGNRKKLETESGTSDILKVTMDK